MSHIILNKWRNLQQSIKEKRKFIDSEQLTNLLLIWALEIKEIKDERVKQLYFDYLKYFENINVNDYKFSAAWYSLDEIIDIDIIEHTPRNYEHPVAIVSRILWELLVFKSDKNCPNCNYDDLRVFTQFDKMNLFYCCDNCGFICDENSNKVETSALLTPITSQLATLYNLKPSH